MKLGDRMKTYEGVTKTCLMKRTPVIIRIDGKAFHTWTRSLSKPFDDNMVVWMANTTRYLVENIQNAVFGYCQSDEISILLRDYDNLTTDQWFNGNVQKITSVSASFATAKFNDYVNASGEPYDSMPLAFFDARVFNIPKEEVTNYFIWRQQDAIRNSIQALGRYTLGHKECQNKNGDQIKQMLKDTEYDWDNLPMHYKYGAVFHKKNTEIQLQVPEFKELREYVDVHILP